MRGTTVLILVRELLGAGLIGTLVEALGKEPVFPAAGESAESALTRLRPPTVLLECYHPAARSDAFFIAAEEAGSRVVLFAPRVPWDDAQEIARRRSVVAFVYPAAGESLAALLARALVD